MPKMKTHSSLKDRFKITGTGKVKRYKAYKNHLLSHKSGRQKRVLGYSATDGCWRCSNVCNKVLSNLK